KSILGETQGSPDAAREGVPIKLLRNLATGKLGPRPIQVVLATHSAELLEYVRPEEVRFLNRIPEDGGVRVDTSSKDWQDAFREYTESLGSAWLAGGLGGVPGAEAAE